MATCFAGLFYVYPDLFMNLRNEMFKYQEIQETADQFEAGNSELCSNQI